MVKRVAIVLILVLAVTVLISEKRREDRRVQLQSKIAREIELRKIRDYGVGDWSSPSEILKNPPPASIVEIVPPPQLTLSPGPRVDTAAISDRLERDEMRRDIDGLKRQADLDRMNHDIERREAEKTQRKRDRERILGLDSGPCDDTRSPQRCRREDIMSTYTATIRWSRAGEGDFAKGQYSRAHV